MDSTMGSTTGNGSSYTTMNIQCAYYTSGYTRTPDPFLVNRGQYKAEKKGHVGRGDISDQIHSFSNRLLKLFGEKNKAHIKGY